MHFEVIHNSWSQKISSTMHLKSRWFRLLQEFSEQDSDREKSARVSKIQFVEFEKSEKSQGNFSTFFESTEFWILESSSRFFFKKGDKFSWSSKIFDYATFIMSSRCFFFLVSVICVLISFGRKAEKEHVKFTGSGLIIRRNSRSARVFEWVGDFNGIQGNRAKSKRNWDDRGRKIKLGKEPLLRVGELLAAQKWNRV